MADLIQQLRLKPSERGESYLDFKGTRSSYPFDGVRFFQSRSGGVVHIMDKGYCCCKNYGTVAEFLDDSPYNQEIHWHTGRFVPQYSFISPEKMAPWVRRVLKQGGDIRPTDNLSLACFTYRLCITCKYTLENRLTNEEIPKRDYVVEGRYEFRCGDHKEWPKFACKMITGKHDVYWGHQYKRTDVKQCKKKGHNRLFLCTFHLNRFLQAMTPLFAKEVSKVILSFA
jgi:hypothetical protein